MVSKEFHEVLTETKGMKRQEVITYLKRFTLSELHDIYLNFGCYCKKPTSKSIQLQLLLYHLVTHHSYNYKFMTGGKSTFKLKII